MKKYVNIVLIIGLCLFIQGCKSGGGGSAGTGFDNPPSTVVTQTEGLFLDEELFVPDENPEDPYIPEDEDTEEPPTDIVNLLDDGETPSTPEPSTLLLLLSSCWGIVFFKKK